MAEIPSYLQPNAAPLTPEAPAMATPEVPHVDMAEAAQPSEQVFDVRHNATINIPHSEVEVAVRSGLYAPLNDKEFVVRDSDGNTHAVKGANLKAALDEGNTFATPEESHAHLVKRKYGDSPVLAGLEGIERGALPGVSDRVLAGSKTFNGGTITQEDLAGRAEANPIAAGVGEVAGMLVSPLNKLIAPGAAAVEVGAARTLTKIGAKAGLSNKVAQAIVSKVIPTAAGSAVEGAYFGAAHLLNEDALGNAQFNAENLLSSVEQGALWGAAFGGGLSAAGLAAKGTATAIAETNAGKYLGNKVSGAFDSLSNSTKATREFLGLTPAKARKLAERDAGFMDDAIAFTRESLEQNPRASIVEIAGKAKSDMSEIGEKIGTIYNKIDDVASTSGISNTISHSDLKTKIASTIEEKILPKLEGIEGAAAERKMVNEAINEIADSAAASGNVTAKELHSRMRNLDELIFTEEGALKSKTLKSKMLRVQRDVIREELNSATKLAEKNHPELAGIFSELKGANRRFSTLKQLEKSVAAASDAALNGGGMFKANSFYSLGKAALDSEALRKMQILGKIEKFQQQTKAAMASGFKALGDAANKVTPSLELAATKTLVDSHIATELVDGKKRKPKDEQQAYRNILANAKFAAENPEQFMQGVNKYSSHMYAVAPKTSGALDTAALNAMVFLHSKAPKSTKSKGFFDAGKFDKASGAQMLKLQQRIDMIQRPSKAIQLLGKGKLGATHVETIKAVYPELHAEMQKQAMNFLSSKDAIKLTYSQKLNMATLLGVQADESMHFSNVLGLQANFDTKDEAGGSEGGGVVNSTQGGLAKVNKASRMDTDDSNDT